MSNLDQPTKVISCEGHAKASCIEALPTRDSTLGEGMKIRRALPQRDHPMVGAWCFLDHFGPLARDDFSGSIEVGHINFSPRLQRTPAATEAMYLMMKRAFELGYRRYEWKCDALNARSRAAAQRLGLSFEGVFRQATIYKGRNRDTAWYAAIDQEWPDLDNAFSRWLDPANFDENGRQRTRLTQLTEPILKKPG